MVGPVDKRPSTDLLKESVHKNIIKNIIKNQEIKQNKEEYVRKKKGRAMQM